MRIQILDRTDIERDFHSVEERWSVYVDNFVKLDGSLELLKQKPASDIVVAGGASNLVNSGSVGAAGGGLKLFLARNLARKSNDNFILGYNLECKICVNTYKMFFVENSEDFLFRARGLAGAAGGKKEEEFESKSLASKQAAFMASVPGGANAQVTSWLTKGSIITRPIITEIAPPQ
jgi:hypothetical protein